MPDPDYALFATLADAGSLSAAGRTLGLSPAQASKRLARLEARLGVRLVHRTTRRLALTAPGERFLHDVRAILAQAAAAEAALREDQGTLAGVLRVSAPTSFGRLHVAPHLGRFLAAHPNLTVAFDLSDGYVDLVGERVDLAIRIGAQVDSALAAHRLGTSARVLCAAPAYLTQAEPPATVAALTDHALLAADGQLPWTLVADGRVATVEGPSRVRTNSSEVVRELALAGAGVALRSLWDVQADLDAGRLRRVLPAWRGSAEVGVFAVHPRSSYPPAAVTAFVGWLRTLPLPLADAAQSAR